MNGGFYVYELFLVLLILVALPYFCGKTAQKKGYSFGGFFLLGLFGNIFGLLISLCIPDRNFKSTSYTYSPADEIMKYKYLYEQGVISYEEFERKKRELIG